MIDVIALVAGALSALRDLLQAGVKYLNRKEKRDWVQGEFDKIDQAIDKINNPKEETDDEKTTD